MQEQYKMFDTLLKGLNDADYDAIIAQENLRAKGYKIHYVIDANLIQNYCYPKGINEHDTDNERISRLTNDYIADEQVTLHTVFKLNKGNQRVIFFDQYLYEFQAMIYTATRNGTNNSYELNLPNFNLSINNEEFKELLYNNFSKIIAKVLLNINGLKKASSLFKERLIIFESEELESDFLKKGSNICKGTQSQTDLIYKIWKDTHKYELYHSKKRDAVIFDRILSFNNYIQKFGKYEDKKHIFILLSDSTLSKKFFKHLIKTKTKIEYPEIEGEKIELIRSIPQTFAYLISLIYKENKDIDHQMTIKNLKKLRSVSRSVGVSIKKTERIIWQNNPTWQNIDILLSKEYGEIFANYRQLRNAFENTGLLKSFDGLYESIKDEIKKLDFKELDPIFQRIKKELDALTKEINTEHSEYLRRLEEEATFTTTFINSIEQVNTSQVNFEISKGDDFVEGSYQHLPIFLIFPLDSIEYRNHMNKLMLLILNRKTEESKNLCNELEALIDAMKNSRSHVNNQFEINLLKAFIFMILPSNEEHILVDDTEKGRENDKIAFKWLQLLNKNKSKDKLLDSDLKYLLCWVTRRLGNYKNSLKYAEEGITCYTDDPRFYHGKFLAQYCIFESKVKTRKKIIEIDDMLKNLEKARSYYIPFIKTKFFGYDTNLMLSKLDDTFNNSYCYCTTLKAYQLHVNNGSTDEIKNLLSTAREHLNAVKSDGQYKDELPEYFDTEAHLEYLESFYSDNKIEKAYFAKNAIEMALSLSNHKELIEKYFDKLHKIHSRIKELED